MSELVIEERQAGIGVLTLNRPTARNAFNAALLQCLARKLTELSEDDAVRCIIVTGGADCFGSGGDVREMAAASPVELWRSPRHGWWDAIHSCPKPLIAAVNGPAYGGGCELALACDIILAGTTARFALPEVKLGIAPGRGGTQRLPGLVGKSAAMYMILTGESIDAATALRLGLVLEVCETGALLARALEMGLKIAARAPVAVQVATELIRRAAAPSLDSGMALERHCYEFLAATPDGKEGMAAHLEKRPAQFTGE